MTTQTKLIKGGAWLSGNQIIIAVSRFIRNIIIARIIAPHDFGIGVTFALAVSLLEMASDMGMERMIVQSEEGEDDRMQGAAHLLIITRGALISSALFLASPLLATLFGIPDKTWAFQILAFVPLIKGFTHLDIIRLQRHFGYQPYVITYAVSSSITTIVALPLVLWLRDFTVFLWLTLMQVLLETLLSHLLSHRRYQVVWNRYFVQRFFKFGWPLLINNLILYGIFNGDRFVIGSLLDDKSFLAVYSIAFSFALIPALMLANMNSSMLLPLFSRAQNDEAAYQHRFNVSCQIQSLVSGFFACFLILYGGWLVVFLYGARYQEAAHLVGWFGCMQAIYLLRELPIKASTARGDTLNTMISNLFRSFSILLAIIIVSRGGNLIWVAAAGILGELMAFIAATIRLKLIHQVPLWMSWRSLLFVAGGILLSLGFLHLKTVSTTALISTGGIVALAATYLLVGFYFFKELRERFLNPITLLFRRQT